MKVILLTYSDDRFGRKDGKYSETQNYIDSLLKKLEFPIIHKKLTFNDISNNEFIIKNKDYFNSSMDYNGRAFKPFIIKNELQSLEHDDILIYNDCSPEIWNSNTIHSQIQFIKKNSHIKVIGTLLDQNNNIILCYCPAPNHTHHHYTLDICIKTMDAEKYRHSLMPGSGLIFIRKRENTLNLIDEWLHYNMIPECASLGIHNEYWNNECSKKQGHRHDQSIISILLCKYNYKLLLPNNFPIKNQLWNFINYIQLNHNYQFIDPNTHKF